MEKRLSKIVITLQEPRYGGATIAVINGLGGMTEGCDMSQGCSQGYKPKTGPKRTQKEYIPKQRKFKYFTSLKLW
jgi:hypothetical protein